MLIVIKYFHHSLSLLTPPHLHLHLPIFTLFLSRAQSGKSNYYSWFKFLWYDTCWKILLHKYTFNFCMSYASWYLIYTKPFHIIIEFMAGLLIYIRPTSQNLNIILFCHCKWKKFINIFRILALIFEFTSDYWLTYINGKCEISKC